ncbi:MAG: hypothetical protein H0U74_14030 [Bradymonadaceae bacterium]|nr:hypothetical protein [Lujinxingiaceae bacterium]
MLDDKFVLVLENEAGRAPRIGAYLERELSTGQVLSASSSRTLAQALEQRTFDLAVVSLPLDWGEASEVLDTIGSHHERCPIILALAPAIAHEAVKVMRLGIDDCVLLTANENTFFHLLHNSIVRMENAAKAAVHPERDEHVYIMGQLASTVAHDFNNLLTIIHGYSHLAIRVLRDGKDPSLIATYLEKIADKTTRGSELVDKIMRFTRKPKSQPVVLNVTEFLRDMNDMLRQVIGEGIELDVELDAQSAPVFIDPKALELVLMNLVDNACDAMQGRGKLTIETAVVALDKEESRKRDMPQGRYVALRVSDTGAGMDERMTSQIFDAFFTTKQLGAGTGLGLASVQSSVREHDGHIFVQSTPGQGTTFEILWPCHDMASNQSLAEPR